MTTNRPSRTVTKAELEAQIEQQRVDILVAASLWRSATRPIDDGWRNLMRFKAPLYAAGGLLLFRIGRHPGRLLRLGRRATAGALVVNRVRRLLR
ncbi:YqjK-like family protein [Halomonas sp. G15]|uniref:YqjK-like family protein n=1 Tax=Halomonas sp. G15 TaxID=2903521 RepID=UPI001E4F11BE|nr:YqjK-like family protein [Halomonas sp. G15]MCE0733247.1 YqjK-like family protein [Halomonas sp. G15]